MLKQTWWNDNAVNLMGLFKSWVGDENAESKVYMANYLKNKNYYTLIDCGCGNGTFYYTLKNNNINIEYTGVDSCEYFIELNTSNGIKMINSDIRNIDISDNSYDIVFSRHVIEHQPEFNIILNEFIRIGKKEVCHIFFIKPHNETEDKINYDNKSNLYHNNYSKKSIENFLSKNKKISSWNWIEINDKENALHIYLI
jgi:ubiquinone/menaquinone biosynthesis C-methylase UbiE